MPVIAVVNRKGGSGKSTLATHLAALCANRGLLAMLGDVDRQQSTQTWLRLRSTHELPRSAPILGWALDPRNVMRAPAGITHVILDTPGGLRGFDLARVVGYADVILMPVCNSIFDRESAADCHAELMALPRVASGRCKVAAIGMRLDARTRGADTMQAWAESHGITYLGLLRETQAYVRTVEQGLTIFDLPPSKAEVDLAQWSPILDWLEPLLRKAPTPEAAVAADTPGDALVPVDDEADNPAPSAVLPVPVRMPLPVPPTAPPRNASAQSLAQTARAMLPVPQNLGEVTSGGSLKQRLSRLFGSRGGRLSSPSTP